MTVVQQILYTNEPERWWSLAAALGFVAPFEPAPEWAEFHAGGVLALHGASDAKPAGAVDIHLLVEDLDAAESRLQGCDVTRSEMEGVGEVLTVRVPDGPPVTVSAGGVVPSGELRPAIGVQPVWYQPDLLQARSILEQLGCRADVVSSRGTWAELRADAGSVGLHIGAPQIGAAFETFGSPDALVSRLRTAGFEASVVDEAWGSTVRAPSPDGGPDIWINAPQEDMYGFIREGTADIG